MPSIIATATDDLVSLVYVSSGVREFEDSEITALLTQSHRNNETCGVTGMLLYRDGNFLQVLEGPEVAVQATLQRIKSDNRHGGIMVLKNEHIQSRHFPEWTMTFRKLGSEDLRDMEGYSPFMEQSFNSDAFKAEPDFCYRMLLQFKKKMR
jgi:hypothetical protein